MDWAMERGQRQMAKQHYGLLEIFLDAQMNVIDRPLYRMRLDNVGPRVRENLRGAGRVGDVPVNKLVRICSDVHRGVRVNPPTTVATILITADGYVRASNWAEYERMFFSPTPGPIWDPGGFGACMDQLRAGEESPGCRIDKATKAREITGVAEIAQNLSLSYLDG
jgi:hypothetical protein